MRTIQVAQFIYTLQRDLAPHCYYPRLRGLLSEPSAPGQQYPSFDMRYELWSNLEQWSILDRQGALGVLRFDLSRELSGGRSRSDPSDAADYPQTILRHYAALAR